MAPDYDSGLRVTVLSSSELRIATRVVDVNKDSVHVLSADEGEVPVKNVTSEGGGDFRLVLSSPLAAGRWHIEIGEEVSAEFDIRGRRNADCVRHRPSYSVPLSEPELDYQAKDYVSFRRLMLDRMSQLMPEWKEENPADIGVTLVEALAYHADQLSYYQDAVANEAYLETALHRVSVGRHARLLDYMMHEGCSARCLVHFWIKQNRFLQLEPATKLATFMLPERAMEESTLRTIEEAPLVFETIEPASLGSDQNFIYIYPLEGKCLSKGTFRVLVRKEVPSLRTGSLLILASIRGWNGEFTQQPDIQQAHPVRLTHVYPSDAQPGCWVLEWAEEDALPFIMDPSPAPEGGVVPLPIDPEETTTVALGNIVAADQGLTYKDEALDPVAGLGPGGMPSLVKTAHLGRNRLAFTVDNDPMMPAASFFSIDPKDAKPSVSDIVVETGTGKEEWTPVFDPLENDESARTFIVEMGDDGSAFLEADGLNDHLRTGRKATMRSYRLGAGAGGNVGMGSIYHVLGKEDIGIYEDAVEGITNPIPAMGGTGPESLEHVKLMAPHSFKQQLRAVTLADFEMRAMETGLIQRAKAVYRHTGSWTTVVIAIDPKDINLLDEDRLRVANALEAARMAGQDVEVVGPVFVPIVIMITVIIKKGFLFEDIEYQLNNAFSGIEMSDGRKGIFHPDRMTFEQPLYLSDVYKEAGGIQGVESVQVVKFRRLDDLSPGTALPDSIYVKGREVIILENDPENPENGLFQVQMGGWA